jgi:hypothetical protein
MELEKVKKIVDRPVVIDRRKRTIDDEDGR